METETILTALIISFSFFLLVETTRLIRVILAKKVSNRLAVLRREANKSRLMQPMKKFNPEKK